MLRTTAHWLFPGKALVQLFELRAEQVTFPLSAIFTRKSNWQTMVLTNYGWLFQHWLMAGTFSLQGKQLTMFVAKDKNGAFKRKLDFGKTCISHSELTQQETDNVTSPIFINEMKFVVKMFIL